MKLKEKELNDAMEENEKEAPEHVLRSEFRIYGGVYIFVKEF